MQQGVVPHLDSENRVNLIGDNDEDEEIEGEDPILDDEDELEEEPDDDPDSIHEDIHM